MTIYKSNKNFEVRKTEKILKQALIGSKLNFRHTVKNFIKFNSNSAIKFYN